MTDRHLEDEILEVLKRLYSKMIEGKSINPYEYRGVVGDLILKIEYQRTRIKFPNNRCEQG
jgi:hypothetical protein